MNESKWLASLQVGDPVIVKFARGKRGYPAKITRLGANLIIVGGGSRFRRNGQQGHHGLWLEEPAGKAKR